MSNHFTANLAGLTGLLGTSQDNHAEDTFLLITKPAVEGSPLQVTPVRCKRDEFEAAFKEIGGEPISILNAEMLESFLGQIKEFNQEIGV